MAKPSFQPFSDRLSRDIRNDLSESIVKVIQTRSLSPAEETAESYLQKDLASCYREYIEQRLHSYTALLNKLPPDDISPLHKGLLLWDEGLFFEVHEVLELAWLEADGDDRLFLQAMIRAAGAYIKLEAGFRAPAERIAAKALPVLERNRHRLCRFIDPDILVEAMKDLPTPPPKLLVV